MAGIADDKLIKTPYLCHLHLLDGFYW